jgi:hypothetical protein
VLSLHGDPPGHRRIVTLRYLRSREPRTAVRQDRWVEEGSCPADRVGRLVDGVVRRAGADRQPVEPFEIDGRVEAWASLLDALGRPG